MSAEYGRRPIAAVVDQIARDEPDRVWSAIPRTQDCRDGWEDITFKRFANSVNRASHRLIKDLGKPSNFETVAYIGPNDLRYMIFMLATIKTGYRVLFISPRNSEEGQLNLFDKTDCNILYYASSMQKTISPWLEHREMKTFMVGEQSAWLDETEAPEFPYNKTHDECRWDPFAVLHTSGSTGLPKPIVVRQGAIAVGDAHHNAEKLDGRMTWTELVATANRVFCPMPLFHAAGLYVHATFAIFWKVPVVLGFPSKPINVDLIRDCLNYSNCDGAFLPPSILEEMSRDPESLEALRKLRYASFGGGAVATAAGDALVKAGVKLTNLIASTEAAFLGLYQQDPEDWTWFVFGDELSGFKWKKVEGTDDIYEQFIVRKDNPSIEQGLFYTFPDINEWSTSDLFRKHPTKPNNWQYYGRADNIIVFSNGEKLNPATIEDYVMGHPKLIGGVVVGAGRFQPALIIEPKEPATTDEEAKALIEDVWPVVVKANKSTVAHGQIGKQFITVTKPDKPFPRAGKGSIQRKLAISMYKDEIDELYEKSGDLSAMSVAKLDLSSEDALMLSIEQAFIDVLGISSLEPDTDFFSAGIDSMQVLTMSRNLRVGLEVATGHEIEANTIATRVIYNNPTPRRLAAELYAEVVGGHDSHEKPWQVQDQQAMLAKYTRDLPAARSTPVPPATSNLTVLLTGSTGSLGSYMLADLIENRNVTSIIALNRAEDGLARQTKSSELRGLTTDFSKVEFLHADLAADNFGLEKSVYVRLLHAVDRIVHNQWQVNFNLSLPSFEPFVRGTRHIVDFAAVAEKQPHITFISTIGTAERWGFTHGKELVPEESFADLGLPHQGMDLATAGYGQSKQVASLILEEAAKRSIVSSAIVRVGQIAGPLSAKGEWNRQEWLPTILASSAYLGVMPDSIGIMDDIDWTPSESVAGFILDLAGVRGNVAPAPQGYYHATNPHSTTWQALVPTVRKYFGDRVHDQVSFKQWIETLSASATSDTVDVSRNPAVKLLDHYRGLEAGSAAGLHYMHMDTRKSKAVSPTMQRLEAVKGEWMQLWLEQWGF